MKLLIVEDERKTALALQKGVKRNGYIVDLAFDGQKALESLAVNEYDLLLLDLNLPDIDGLEICRHARRQRPSIPILVLTARNRMEDIVSGLDQGADDYLAKPFHFPELLARIRALLRRDLCCREPQICIGDIILDPVQQKVWKAGRRITFTHKEYAILEYLMRHPDEMVSQEDLLEHVWGSAANIFSNSVRVHIQGLRKKLEDDPANPRYLTTVIGAGYRFSIQG
jgi:DNA-binding response OmpR family regulator